MYKDEGILNARRGTRGGHASPPHRTSWPAGRVALAALICTAAGGCAGAESLAREQQGHVHPGMSKDEVRRLIGDPHHVVNDALTGGRDEWVFVYGIPKDSAPGPDYLFAFRSVAYFVGYIGTIAAAVYRGADIHCSGYSDAAPEKRSGGWTRIWRFRVVFDEKGSVCEVEDVW